MSDEKRSEDGTDETEKASAEGETEADVEDAANPAAIARRVAALGADDESEALARDEERKLAERREGKKKPKKKTGLEAAASKKLEGLGKRAEPRRAVAVAADADPLIEKTQKLSDWAKRNQKTVQIVGALVALGLLGGAFAAWRDQKRETEASLGLTKAVEAQQAPVGEPPKDKDKDDEEEHLTFKTYDARREAALKQYREVQAKFPKTGAAILSRLAEASLLLDNHEADKALTAYTEVKDSPLAAVDIEVKGRALEGIGFAHELKAASNPADKAKELDAALATYKELETVADVKGFKELAMYHQARVLMDKGDKDGAKSILMSVKERVNRVNDPVEIGVPVAPTYPYLKEVAIDRLREIDPSAAPKEAAPGANISDQIKKMTPEQFKRMMEKRQKQGGH